MTTLLQIQGLTNNSEIVKSRSKSHENFHKKFLFTAEIVTISH